ncbi:Transcription elongation factor [Trichinella pseudospiralis]
MIKSIDQFESQGCDNYPDDSWVGRWQMISKKKIGIYAISVSGTLPNAIVSEIRAMGVHYKPYMRDTTSKV